MGDKRLVRQNRDGEWEVRSPGAHNPNSRHETYNEARLAAEQWRQSVEDGKVEIIL